MTEIRLGDDVDDFCVKCRRVTNHAVVSVVNNEAAKVRCRTCYHDHDFRHEQAPPSKKDLKKAELFNAVLAGANSADGAAQAVADPPAVEVEEAVEQPAEPSEEKKAKGRKKATEA